MSIQLLVFVFYSLIFCGHEFMFVVKAQFPVSHFLHFISKAQNLVQLAFSAVLSCNLKKTKKKQKIRKVEINTYYISYKQDFILQWSITNRKIKLIMILQWSLLTFIINIRQQVVISIKILKLDTNNNFSQSQNKEYRSTANTKIQLIILQWSTFLITRY